MSAGEALLLHGGKEILSGLIGGGGSSKSNPTFGYGTNTGSSFSSGGSQQGSQSTASSWQDPDSVWGVQSPYLSALYQDAAGMVGASAPQQEQAQGLITQGMGGIESLMNPGMNPMMEVYQQQMQQGLEQNILPTIRREAAGRGMVGGTRQGVAEGMAYQEAARQQSQFAAQLYNEDQNRALGAIGEIPGMAQAGLGVPWYGLNQAAGILGDPTVLRGGAGSVSQSSSSAVSSNVGGSESFAENAQGSRGFVEDTFPDRFPSDSSSGGGNGSGFGPYSGPRSNR